MEDTTMKKTFIKFLPLMAAVMLATSCSKDDNDNAPDNGRDDVNTVASQESTIPFSIKVNTGNSLKKIGYKENERTKDIDILFSKEDENVLKLHLSPKNVDAGGYIPCLLTLIDADNGIFNGTIPSNMVGTEVNANILIDDKDYTNPVISSKVSLTELMKNCAHSFYGSFTVGKDEIVMLTDENKYFEFIMSPLQKQLDISINGIIKTVELNDEGKVWIKVGAINQPIKTNFYVKSQKDIKEGSIYTINRSGYVDLGLSNGTLWADKNVGATTYDGAGNYYKWDDEALSSLSLPTGGGDEDADMTILINECDWKCVVDENNPSVLKGFNVFKKDCSDPDKNPHIFLPAANCLNLDNTPSEYVENTCFYWSSETYSYQRSAFKAGNQWCDDDYTDFDEDYRAYNYKYTVRTVRHSNLNKN